MQSGHSGLKKVLDGNCFQRRKGSASEEHEHKQWLATYPLDLDIPYLQKKVWVSTETFEIYPVGTMNTQNTFFFTLKCSILPGVVNISCFGVLDWKSKDEISSITICT